MSRSSREPGSPSHRRMPRSHSTSRGTSRVSRPARDSGRNVRAMGGLPSLIEEEVRDRVADGIRYAGWLLNRVDPTNRLRRVGLACRLAGIGYLPWRTRVEAVQSPNSASMGSGLEAADSPPVVLARAALLFDITRLADDITVRLQTRSADRKRPRKPVGLEFAIRAVIWFFSRQPEVSGIDLVLVREFAEDLFSAYWVFGGTDLSGGRM